MLPDSVEFLLNYGDTHFDRNEISMNHEFIFRFHYNLSCGLIHPNGVAVNYVLRFGVDNVI